MRICSGAEGGVMKVADSAQEADITNFVDKGSQWQKR